MQRDFSRTYSQLLTHSLILRLNFLGPALFSIKKEQIKVSFSSQNFSSSFLSSNSIIHHGMKPRWEIFICSFPSFVVSVFTFQGFNFQRSGRIQTDLFYIMIYFLPFSINVVILTIHLLNNPVHNNLPLLMWSGMFNMDTKFIQEHKIFSRIQPLQL